MRRRAEQAEQAGRAGRPSGVILGPLPVARLAVVRSLLLAVLLALPVAACGAPAPTLPAEPTPGPLPVACHELDLAVCAHAAGLAVNELRSGPATWAEVVFTCQGPCGPGLAGQRQALVTVELATGGGAAIRLDLLDARLVRAAPVDFGLAAVAPSSAAAAGPVVELELGHCGLLSGIDVGGTFWNPVGFIPDHPDAVNTALARVTFTGPDSARLQTEGGMGVELVRHAGAKHLPGCD